MRTRWWVIGAVLVLAILAFGAVSAWGQEATTWYVDGSVEASGDGTSGATAFKTIQEGVNAANAAGGDTINVADGTYTITSVIDVDKGVTITGDVGNPENVLVTYAVAQDANDGFEISAANITIQGIKVENCAYGFRFQRGDTGFTGCTITHCAVETAANCGIGEIEAPNTTISYNTITDCGDKGIYVRKCESASEATRTEIVGNTLSDCGKTWGAAAIQTHEGKFVYIYDNTIGPTNDKGINIIRSHATGTADRIQVVGNNISLCKFPGIQSIGAPYTYIYNNTLTKCNYYGGDGTPDFDYGSITVADNPDPVVDGSHVVVDSNHVSDGGNGVLIWSDNCDVTNNTICNMGLTYLDSKPQAGNDGPWHNSAIVIGGLYETDPNDPSGTIITGNNIHDNYWGLQHDSRRANNVTAEENWWGAADGPGVVGPGSGDKVSANVDYSPWLGETPGTPMTWGTNDSIQEAIDAANDGDTINVANGTYTEQLSITDKGLIITGESEAGVIVQANAGGPVDVQNTFTINAAGKDVTLEYMTIRHGDYGIRSSAGNVNVLHCTIYHNGWDGTGLPDPETAQQSDFHDFWNTSGHVTDGGAVRIENSVSSEVAYNTVYENDRGLRYQHGSNGNFHHNSSYNNIQSGVYLTDHGAPGGCTNTQVHDNTVYGNMNNGILALRGNDNTITNNNVYDNWNTGIHMHGPSDFTVEGNTVTNNSLYAFNGEGNDGNSDGGIAAAGAETIPATNFTLRIEDNHVSNNNAGSHADSTGIWLGTGLPGDGILIQNNTFDPHDIDVDIESQAATIELHFNNFDGLGIGVRNSGTGTVDARNNWWGDASGPSGGVADPVTETPANGTGDAVSANVLFDPWTGAESQQVKTNTVNGTKTIPDNDTVDGIGSIDIDATGDHTITTTKYNANPGGTALGNATGNYWDVHLDNATGVNSIKVHFCPANARTIISYWDGVAWQQCSNQVFNAATNCVEVTVTGATQPTLGELVGLAFGSGTAAGGGGPSLPRPEAEAGEDQTVTVGRLVQLDGSASESRDSSSDWVGYDWSLVVKPTGSRAMLSDSNTVNPTFVPDVPGRYVIALVVTNHSSKTDYDDVTITALEADNALILSAGWHMIAIPLSLEDNASEVVFPDVDPLRLYCYNGQAYDSCQAGTLTAVCCMHGYWICLGEPMELRFQGDPLTGEQVLPLERTGWHMIGVPYPVSWGNDGSVTVAKYGETKSLAEAAAAGWIDERIWMYNAITGAYQAIGLEAGLILDSWVGYWVQAHVSGLVLHFAPSGSAVNTGFTREEVLWRVCTGTVGNPPPPPTLSLREVLEGLEFTVSPNPVVDVNTTYFAVKGAAAYLVEALKVQVYDLSGRLVYENEVAGASLAWHTDNTNGEYLANGVYLYKLYALLDGQWVVSGVKNVVILR